MLRRLTPVLLALVVAGCGSDAKEKPAKAPASAPAATATAAPAAPGTISTDLSQEPVVGKQTKKAPAKLVKKDIVKGHGPKAKVGDLLSVQYTGYLYATDQKFDASWDRGAQPFQFPLGAGQVISGWDRGIGGMRVGGRRELIIPPQEAYGAQGSPPLIGPNEPLIFVVDLVKIG